MFRPIEYECGPSADGDAIIIVLNRPCTKWRLEKETAYWDDSPCGTDDGWSFDPYRKAKEFDTPELAYAEYLEKIGKP